MQHAFMFLVIEGNCDMASDLASRRHSFDSAMVIGEELFFLGGVDDQVLCGRGAYKVELRGWTDFIPT